MANCVFVVRATRPDGRYVLACTQCNQRPIVVNTTDVTRNCRNAGPNKQPQPRKGCGCCGPKPKPAP